MGLFSRNKDVPTTQPLVRTASPFIGRKFQSSLSLAECLDNFSAARDECYTTTGQPMEIEWQVPAHLGDFKSTQGSIALVAPVRVLANDLLGGGRIYLAAWNGLVSYGDGSGTGGPPCEIWFVSPGFDMSPVQIAGVWKRLDPTLSSIGWVESPLWGV